MKIEVDVPEYKPERGTAGLGVEPDSILGAGIINGTMIVNANKAGLISLAIHFLSLAQDDTPIGRDIAYGEWSWFAPGSSMLLVRTIESADHALPRPLEGEALALSNYIREHMRRRAVNNDTETSGTHEKSETEERG